MEAEEIVLALERADNWDDLKKALDALGLWDALWDAVVVISKKIAEYLQELKRLMAEIQKLIPIEKKPKWRPWVPRKASKAKHLLRYYPVGFT